MLLQIAIDLPRHSGMPSFLTSGKTAALIGARRGCNFSTTARRLPLSSGTCLRGKPRTRKASVARSAPADGSMTCGINRSRGHIVEVARSWPLPHTRLAVGAKLHDQPFALTDELAFHVAAEVEVAAMGDALQFAEFARRQEGEGIFDVGRAARIMAQLFLMVIAQPQPFAGQAQIEIPADSGDRARTGTTRGEVCGWQKNSISICSNSRERKVKLRGVISLRKLLPIWAMPNGMRTRRTIEDVLEVDEDALGGFGAEKRGILFAAQGADDGLEHQVEFARRRSGCRASFASGPRTCEKSLTVVRQISGPSQCNSSTSLGAKIEKLEGLLLGFLRPSSPWICAATKIFCALGLDPAAPDLIVAIAFLRLAAVDHEIVKQIVMAGAFPDLRMHDDRSNRGRSSHRRRCAGERGQVVVAGDHVAPPGFLDVALELDAQGAVIPEAVEAAVDFARLKQEAAPFAQRDEFVHVHGGRAQGRW